MSRSWCLILGGKSEIVAVGPGADWQRQIAFDPARVEQLTAVKIETSRQHSILTDLGFEIDDTATPGRLRRRHGAVILMVLPILLKSLSGSTVMTPSPVSLRLAGCCRTGGDSCGQAPPYPAASACRPRHDGSGDFLFP